MYNIFRTSQEPKGVHTRWVLVSLPFPLLFSRLVAPTKCVEMFNLIYIWSRVLTNTFLCHVVTYELSFLITVIYSSSRPPQQSVVLGREYRCKDPRCSPKVRTTGRLKKYMALTRKVECNSQCPHPPYKYVHPPTLWFNFRYAGSYDRCNFHPGAISQ